MDIDQPLTDAERFPAITAAGQQRLRHLREHRFAPIYNYRVGDRLNGVGLTNVRNYARSIESQRTGWQHGELPDWLIAFANKCLRDVPFYRRYNMSAERFFTLPTLQRDSIRREPWQFVPDSADLTDLVVYSTTGTSGTMLRVLSHPEVPCCYLPLIEMALKRFGVSITHSRPVAIVHVCAQLQTYCFPSVISYFDYAGFVKVNLLPHSWRDASHPTAFLDQCAAEIYTGDPIALDHLADLPLTTKPKAIVSSGTTMLPGLRKKLTERFECPVLDLYSMNESGPVACSTPEGFEILPPHLYVEILDPQGQKCSPGERGEIVLTGGLSPFLPLLRYRTGDFASLDFSHTVPCLTGFEGRQPVLFYDGQGKAISSVDVTLALKDCPLSRLILHQMANGSLEFRAAADEASVDRSAQILRELFGPEVKLSIAALSDGERWLGKPIQYLSDWK